MKHYISLHLLNVCDYFVDVNKLLRPTNEARRVKVPKSKFATQILDERVGLSGTIGTNGTKFEFLGILLSDFL